MDVDVTKTPNHFECIRCGMCVTACPTDAVSIRFGLGDAKTPSTKVPGQKISNKEMLSTKVPGHSKNRR